MKDTTAVWTIAQTLSNDAMFDGRGPSHPHWQRLAKLIVSKLSLKADDDVDYEDGYDDGESNVAADWTMALSEVLGEDFEITPTTIAAELQRRLPGNEVVRLKSIRVVSNEGVLVDTLDIRNSVKIEMDYFVLKKGYVLTPSYQFYNELGTSLLNLE